MLRSEDEIKSVFHQSSGRSCGIIKLTGLKVKQHGQSLVFSYTASSKNELDLNSLVHLKSAYCERQSVTNKDNTGQACPELAQSDPQIGWCDLYVTKHHKLRLI